MELGESDDAKPTPNLDRLRNRGDAQYGQWVDEAAKKYGVPADIVASIITHESNGNADAKNPKSNATGLGQFIPKTWNGIKDAVVADAYGNEIAAGKDYRLDPRAAIFGVAYNAADNIKRLAGLKTDSGEPIPVNAVNLKVLHFRGAGAGAKVVQAHESGFDKKRMNQFDLPTSVYEASDSWLSPNSTVGSFYAHFSR